MNGCHEVLRLMSAGQSRAIQANYYNLYGGEFLIQTDHMPLVGLLKEDRIISAMASARIQRWALTLNNYQYTLDYKPGQLASYAHALSH